MALNKSPEQGEANVNSASKNENVYAKLIKKYVSQKLNQKDARLAFVKDIDGSTSLSSDQLNDIKSFAQSNNEFMGLDISADTVSIASLKRESAAYLAQTQSKKLALREEFQSSYAISSADYTKYLSKAIDDISSESELNELLESDTLRHQLVVSEFPKKSLPARKIFS